MFGNMFQVPKQDVSQLLPGTKGFYIQWLITKETGSERFAVRRFVVRPGGLMPMHRHKYVEAVVMLRGRLVVTIGSETKVVGPGDYFFTGPYEPHRIENPFDEEAEFLCSISYEDDMRLEPLEGPAQPVSFRPMPTIIS